MTYSQHSKISHPTTSNARSGGETARPRIPGAGRTAAAVLRHIDIFEAVWGKSVFAMLAPRTEISSGRLRAVELVDCFQHPGLGIVSSADFLSCLNTEQARTLLLCDLVFVQEKLRIGASETRDLFVDIPADAKALATLGSEMRIIAHHTPDLFERLAFTLNEEAMNTLSPDELNQLREFAKLGIRFNLQVRGILSGAGSDIPLQSVKLDPAIVRGVSRSGQQLAILRSIVEMAHRRRVRVIASGLDHMADLQVIRQEQCDEAQGDVIGRPEEIDHLRSRLAGYPGSGPHYRVVSSNR